MKVACPVVVASSLCVFGPVSADEQKGLDFIHHVDCAVYSSLSIPPLKRAHDEDADTKSSQNTDMHMARAIRLGVEIMGSDDLSFAGIHPKALGGSAEAGIGEFFADHRAVENDIFSLRYGSEEEFVEAKGLFVRDLDGKFEALAEWYSLRRDRYQSVYSQRDCARLLEAAEKQ